MTEGNLETVKIVLTVLQKEFEGVPPTAQGMSIISIKKGVAVSKQGVIQSQSGEITIQNTQTDIDGDRD